MNKGESHLSIKPRSAASRSSAAGANRCLRATSTSCARVRQTVPSVACGQMNRPRSRRLANRHSPSPSHHKSFTMSPLRPRKTKTCPENGCCSRTVCTLRTQAIEASTHVGHAGGQPYLRSGAQFDHLRKLSRIERSSDRISSALHADHGPARKLNVNRAAWRRLFLRINLACSASAATLGADNMTGRSDVDAAAGSFSSPRFSARRHLNTWFAFTP